MTYYTVSGNPSTLSRASSSTLRTEFSMIATGFQSVSTDMLARGLKAGDTWTGAHDFTGATLTAATQTVGDASTKVATTAFVAATSFSSVLPGQTSNSGKALTTDGSAASWGVIGVIGGGTGQNSYAIGDLLYASGTTALSKLSDVATGSALISGGVGTAPSWGKVGLTTHISGVLGAANGGTGVANNSANTITFSGNFGLTLTLGGATSLTAPQAGTLATLAGSEVFTNKTLTNPTITNYTETLYAPAAGSAFAVSLANGTVQQLTTNANATVTLPASAAGKSYVIEIVYGGTHTLAWAGGGTIKWPGGVTPAATSVSGKTDIFSFTCDGTYTYGAVIGKSY
jgi:hypothetical protein